LERVILMKIMREFDKWLYPEGEIGIIIILFSISSDLPAHSGIEQETLWHNQQSLQKI
jgi:hypothetical protein